MVDSTLPSWLTELRRREIVERVRNDSRSVGDLLLGLPWETVRNDVLVVGRANFDEPWREQCAPWRELTPAERVLLYAYSNQLGHIHELVAALRMLLAGYTLTDPVVIDLGCGPFTGGLALAATGLVRNVTYVGVDTSSAMLVLGERIAAAAEVSDQMCSMTRHWTGNLATEPWSRAPGWQPVLVIASFLLASATLDSATLVRDLSLFLDRIGHGSVLVLCTNSKNDRAGRNFPAFRMALEQVGFQLVKDDVGQVPISGKAQPRELRYALFLRQERRTLTLDGE